MCQLKFANTYDEEAFIKFNEKPIVEDYFKIENNIFCVADGVTRDLTNGEPIKSYPKTFEEVKYWLKYYPNPSGAYTSAKICCDNFVNYIKQMEEENITESAIKDVAIKVNKDIAEINKNRTIDYLKEDYYCCEAAGGIIKGNTLYCFSIGDTIITLINDKYEKIFETTNTVKISTEYRKKIPIFQNGDWNDKNIRLKVRKEFRNNPNIKVEGQMVGFGSLTGEKEAEQFINTYKLQLDNVKYICAYSDGCEPNFQTTENIKKLILNPESIKESGDEKTLIIYEI